MKDSIQQAAEALLPEMIAIRRHLHRHPELSFEEKNTMQYIAAQLDAPQIPYQKNVAGTGIVALVKGKNPDKKCVALRADIDALPIQEANKTDYCSQNPGVMHACGHDVHTACLIGAANILQQHKNDFEGTIKLIFQPGEEKSPGGASLMIDEGVLENPKVEAIIGLHVYPDLPAGKVAFKSGEYMASSDEIHITITGKGGHAALPHTTIDPITIAANLIVALQQIVSRRANPLMPTVLSFGKISGGAVNNVIPEQVTLSGTLRTFDELWRKTALEMIANISKQTAAMWGATAEIHFPPGYPTLFNEPQLQDSLKVAAEDYLGEENVGTLERRMTAEDFSFYTQKIPGCFFRLGTNKDNLEFTTPVHNPNFDINEAAMATGAGILAWLAMEALGK